MTLFYRTRSFLLKREEYNEYGMLPSVYSELIILEFTITNAHSEDYYIILRVSGILMVYLTIITQIFILIDVLTLMSDQVDDQVTQA